MSNRLLNTRLRQAGAVGAIALLAGVVGFMFSFQPDTSAASGEDQYLQGLWMGTLFPGTDFAQRVPCTFNADLVSVQVEGTFTCTQIQAPVGIPDGPSLGLQGPVIHGAWELTARGQYRISGFGTLFDAENGSYSGIRTADGAFTLQGDTLTGTFTSQIKDNEGNLLLDAPTPVQIERFSVE